MAQQVVIAGALFNDVPSISVPDSNNVWHPFLDTTIASNAAAAADIAQGKLAYVNGSLVTGTNQGGGGGGSWSWMGENPTKVKDWSERVYLKNTPIPNWTWSTSTTSGIIAASDLSPAQTLNLDSYDYIHLVKFKVAYDYGNWSPLSAPITFSFVGSLIIYGRFSSYTAISSGTPNSNSSLLYGSAYGLTAKNGSGVDAYSSNTYGVNVSAMTSPTVSSTSTGTPSVTFKSPAINIRGNATYFSQTAFNNLDFDASYYDMVNELWRVDRGTSPSGYSVKEHRDLLLGGA